MIKYPTCSTLVLAALLSDEIDQLDLTGYTPDIGSLLRAWSYQCIGPSLVQLNLSTLDIKSEDLFKLLDQVYSLQELNVSYVKDWHDNHVEHVAKTCQHLRELNMNWCSSVTDVSLTHIARHCAATIENLGLAGTTLSATGSKIFISRLKLRA